MPLRPVPDWVKRIPEVPKPVCPDHPHALVLGFDRDESGHDFWNCWECGRVMVTSRWPAPKG